MTQLTPYDTGQRCEAMPWLPLGTQVTETTPAENFGKVDFDDDCGDSVCTVYVERTSDAEAGSYELHVTPFTDLINLRVLINGQPAQVNVTDHPINQTKLANLLANNTALSPEQLAQAIAAALTAGDLT